jgi:hypothetical protein
MDILEFIETHAWSYDFDTEKHVRMDINYQEKKALSDFDKHRFNLILKKTRQVGLTSLYVLYVVHQIIYGKEKQKIFYVSRAGHISQHFIKRVKLFLHEYGFQSLIDEKVGHTRKILFKNGTELHGIWNSVDALHGYMPDILIIDEAAFLEKFEEFMKNAIVSVNVGGRVLIGSTPNGYEFFKSLWDSDFYNKNELHWSGTSRFDEEWYENMKRMLNMNERAIRQELDGEFLICEDILEEISIKLPKDLYDIVSKKYNMGNRSVSEYIRDLIEKDINLHH